MFTKENSIIAQSKNGSGKTGAFVVGSLLRVDSSIKAPQVVVLVHTRDMVNQIAEVYEKITKFDNEITVCNILKGLDDKA